MGIAKETAGEFNDGQAARARRMTVFRRVREGLSAATAVALLFGLIISASGHAAAVAGPPRGRPAAWPFPAAPDADAVRRAMRKVAAAFALAVVLLALYGGWIQYGAGDLFRDPDDGYEARAR